MLLLLMLLRSAIVLIAVRDVPETLLLFASFKQSRVCGVGFRRRTRRMLTGSVDTLDD